MDHLQQLSDEQRELVGTLCGYRPYVERILFRKFGRRNKELDLDECLQNAYFKACRHIGSFRGECDVKTWFVQIVINEYYMILRKPARLCYLEDYAHSFSEDPEHHGMEGNLLADVAVPPDQERVVYWNEVFAYINTHFPPEERQIFLLRSQGYDNGEIAERLGMSEQNVKTITFRARVNLRLFVEHGVSSSYCRKVIGPRKKSLVKQVGR